MTSGVKILIIDDDERNLQILSMMLSDFYWCETAASGEVGLDVFATFQPDIVLLDIMMPGIDGYEVCRTIRSGRLRSDTKILLITAKTALKDRLEGYEVGADDYIIKPFDEEELLAKIKVFVRLHQTEAQLKQLNRRLLLRQQDIPNILWECDIDCRFTYVDENTATILGRPPADLVGQPLVDCLVPEVREAFKARFAQELTGSDPGIRGLTLGFQRADGGEVKLQIFADPIPGDSGDPAGMTGIFRDMSAFTALTEGDEELAQNLTVSLDETGRLVFIGDGVRQYLSTDNDPDTSPVDFRSWLVDASLGQILDFALNQHEDVPFPLEIGLTDEAGVEHHFEVQFSWSSNGSCLEGRLVPIGADDHLALVSRRFENQAAELKKAVVIDAEMRESILTDARNLAAETLGLVKALEVYVFFDSSWFVLAEYGEFLHNRSLQPYTENLRLLGNKIHGLKGSCGFLSAPAKQLCHRMEDITRPLAELELVLTQSLSQLLKQFVFRIEEMLEALQQDPAASLAVDDCLERIDTGLEQARRFLGEDAEAFATLIRERSLDRGEVRHRKKEEYLSVSLEGYEELAERVKELFYLLSDGLDNDQRVQAGTLYNQFLNTHQQIKKVPLNLCRYERLVPQIARDYQKEADFYFKDHQVRADREFWNVIHEMLNHLLKNAVIHGIETPEERQAQSKSPTGKVEVELREDAMHILLSVGDDGRGIDAERIGRKAVEMGLTTEEQLGRMLPEEVLKLVFLQGVSTAGSLDDNAGRGVGMNAVQEAINQLQGEVWIENRPGLGCRYRFSFLKANVSLPCIVIALGDLCLAVPEDYVESFIAFRPQDIVTVKQLPAIPYNGQLVPLVDVEKHFDQKTANVNGSVIIMRDRRERKAMVIDRILHHANLPILPLPRIYRKVSIYQGITLYNNDPVQVLNIERLY
jgi:PAS domain S-box-containing protein